MRLELMLRQLSSVQVKECVSSLEQTVKLSLGEDCFEFVLCRDKYSPNVVNVNVGASESNVDLAWGAWQSFVGCFEGGSEELFNLLYGCDVSESVDKVIGNSHFTCVVFCNRLVLVESKVELLAF